ncbi:5-(carboxyamino)imidazole ribonucleotide mutase [Candidatus Aerophobetes bacterium Ae_b3b]|nr:MAG: 5-(carboxyamino)imidazole ribonucleotide mutase [Candidatus Aerophobetes bacterium Ae_b3b]
MGSESDREVMKNCLTLLDEFTISYEVKVLSAHRTPEATSDYAKHLESRGIKVVIAGAGGAAHLPGTMAAHTTLPVIGVPLTSSLQGLDSLYSIVQMPSGVPVACMALGAAGAKNAAVLAAQILALSSPEIKKKLKDYKVKLARGSFPPSSP